MIGHVLAMLREFWAFLGALFERMDKVNLGLISAGVAFYAMFAVFPGLAAIIAIWSIFFDASAIQSYMNVADEFLPPEAAAIIDSQIAALMSGGRTTLGWTTALSLLIATVAARAGVDALVRGLNAIHSVRSHPTVFGFILAYALTLGIVGIVLMGMATIVIVPLAFNLLPPGNLRSFLLSAVPWVAMFFIVQIGIGLVYRYGPNTDAPRTRLFTWGALLAAALWAAASVAFSAYLGSFNSYNRIYGSIGAVVALLMWFYLAGFSVMLGALVNVELARRKRIAAARKARERILTENV